MDQVAVECTVTDSRGIAWLYMCLCMIAPGEGFMRACMLSFGGDQFNSDDPLETKQTKRFSELVAIANYCGGILGLVLIVWIENYKDWILGFGTSVAVVLAGLIVVTSGFVVYRIEETKGSPWTHILQKTLIPENSEDPEKVYSKESVDAEELPHRKDLLFLNKASIFNGETSPWLYCTITEIEETKSFLKLMPVLISNIPLCLLLTFTVQVGATFMNTKIGSIHVSSASLFVIPLVIQLTLLFIYNHIVDIPIKQKHCGTASTSTSNLVRVGIWFGFVMVAACVAAVIERKRRLDFKKDEVTSVFWLLAQFTFVSLTDVTSLIGLMDFFWTELPEKIKLLHTSLVLCVLGFGTWIGGLLMVGFNRATRHDGKGRVGWLLDGESFNETRLDFLYLLIYILTVAFFTKLFVLGQKIYELWWELGYI